MTIKAMHTFIFATIGGAIAMVVRDGVLQSPRRRTAVAAGMVLAESAIYASNNQVCPLTPLAEQLGARRGSVADIYLPDWLSSRIPVVGGSALLLGLALKCRGRSATTVDGPNGQLGPEPEARVTTRGCRRSLSLGRYKRRSAPSYPPPSRPG